METKSFTAEESLDLITRTIRETRRRFQENGFIFIFWGILVFAASLGEFILNQAGRPEIAYYPYFLMPAGGVFTFFYYFIKGKRHQLSLNVIGRMLSAFGISLGVNFLVLGFVFYDRLGEAMVPVFIIFLAFWSIISGFSIRFAPLVVSGIMLNLLGFAAFFVNATYQPLIMSAAALIGVLAPGVILHITRRKHV